MGGKMPSVSYGSAKKQIQLKYSKRCIRAIDPNGNMIFRGDSPNGSSLFGLITAKATAQLEQEQNPNATVVVASKSMVSTNVEMYGWLFAMIVQNPVIIVIVLAVLALVAYLGWWKRRL